MKYRKSKFDNSVLVIFLEKGDEKYDTFSEKFKKHGYAFIHEKTIMVDYTTLEKLGYSDKDHLTFIESHEISHKILKHTSVQRKTETEADYLGILLCLENGFKKSAKVGIENFKSRNNISFEKYDNKYRSKFLNFAKK